MTTLAEQTRINLSLDTSPGLPKLPHIPQTWDLASLTQQQKEENLLHLALWIVERDEKNLDMEAWHKQWLDNDAIDYFAWCKHPSKDEGYHTCGTTHCIAGFAQAMAGREAFSVDPRQAGLILLGAEAEAKFNWSNNAALLFLAAVIVRNS